jgi:nicotinate-nucleotide pyrophosphorylase (carboxylating)
MAPALSSTRMAINPNGPKMPSVVSAAPRGRSAAPARHGIHSVRRIPRAIAGSRFTRRGSRKTMKNSASRKASSTAASSPMRRRTLAYYPQTLSSPLVADAVLTELVARALAEDVGDGDVTTAATVPERAIAHARVTQKAPGVIYGLDVAAEVFRLIDPELAVQPLTREGEWREHGPVLELEGRARSILTAERTALNFLARLSGVATMAARAARAVEGTGAIILDTRKTTPGLRALEKAAVAAGGATNHRFGLFDAILIKENHSAIAGGVGEAVRAARAYAPDLTLEVECRTIEEVDEALAAGAPWILLDNMSVEQMADAVRHVAGRAKLEASGGVTLDTLRGVASTGVNFISLGALTHSAPALDLSLLLEPEPIP